MFRRTYEPLDQHIQPNRALLIYGPRRVGKTTLLQNFLAQTSLKYKLDSAIISARSKSSVRKTSIKFSGLCGRL